MAEINDALMQFWALAQGRYVALGVTVLGALGLLALVAFQAYDKTTHRAVKPLAIWVASNLALLLNAEGTWHVLTVTISLPHAFAALVMGVFELAFLVAMGHAKDVYRVTGHPGAAIYVGWFIALSSGVVVASGARTGTEVLLRIILPVMIMLLTWAVAFSGRTRRSAFAHSPRRLMERWGWLVPDADPDFERMARERKTRSLVLAAHRVRSRPPRPESRSLRKLWRLALMADESMALTVSAQLDRTDELVARVIAQPLELLLTSSAQPLEQPDSERPPAIEASAHGTVAGEAETVLRDFESWYAATADTREHTERSSVSAPDGRELGAHAELLDALALGAELSGPIVSERYSLPASTARRWLNRARMAWAQMNEVERAVVLASARERLQGGE